MALEISMSECTGEDAFGGAFRSLCMCRAVHVDRMQGRGMVWTVFGMRVPGIFSVVQEGRACN